jgi:hypothetical protein
MKTLESAKGSSMWLFLFATLIGCSSFISKEANLSFQAHEGPFTVTVYPVNIVRGTTVEYDEDLARDVMQFLRQEHLADPVLGTSAIEIPVKWGRDQSKMARQSAIAFASMVKEAGIQTEYALLVEVLCNTSETRVGGVHFFLSDQAGNLASSGLTNSHWEEFHEVQPHDRHGGYEVAIRMLRRIWQ